MRASNVFGHGQYNDVLSYMVGPVFYPTRRTTWMTNCSCELPEAARSRASSSQWRRIRPDRTCCTMLRGPSVSGSSTGFLIRWPCAFSVDAMHTSFFQLVKFFMDNTPPHPGSLSYYFGKHKRKTLNHSGHETPRTSFRDGLSR